MRKCNPLPTFPFLFSLFLLFFSFQALSLVDAVSSHIRRSLSELMPEGNASLLSGFDSISGDYAKHREEITGELAKVITKIWQDNQKAS